MTVRLLPIEYLGNPNSEHFPDRALFLYAYWKEYLKTLPEDQQMSEAERLIAILGEWLSRDWEEVSEEAFEEEMMAGQRRKDGEVFEGLDNIIEVKGGNGENGLNPLVREGRLVIWLQDGYDLATLELNGRPLVNEIRSHFATHFGGLESVKEYRDMGRVRITIELL